MSCCFAKTRVQPLDDIFEPVPILKNGKRHRRQSFYPMNVKKDKKGTKDTKDKKDNKDNPISKVKDKIKKNKDILEKSKVDRDAFTEQFLSEVISCGGCQKNFSLGDHALKISCSSCNLFFHCHIAGACVGPNCSVTLDGKKESLKYCISCVNPYLKVNIEDNGQCLCKSCENSSGIPNYYRDV